GNSPTQGPHHVAQKLISNIFPVGFARSLPSSSLVAMESSIGSASIFASSALTVGICVDQFTGEPTVGAVATSTGLPANNASIARRASWDFTLDSAMLSSM